MTALFIAAVSSFIIGSIPFSYLVPLWVKGLDVRRLGSGNPGATNVLRVAGKGLGITCLLLDAGKGVLSVLLCRHLISGSLSIMIPFFAVAGHVFSPFLNFKGGKGVAVSAGLFLALAWPPAIISLLVWIVVVLLTRYVSLASIISAMIFPWSAYFLIVPEQNRDTVVIIGVAAALMIIFRHVPNIRRLIDGSETKIGSDKKALHQMNTGGSQ